MRRGQCAVWAGSISGVQTALEVVDHLVFAAPDLDEGIDAVEAQRLVRLGAALRALKDHDLEEAASTRLLVYAATLIRGGLAIREACLAALVEPLSDDSETLQALMEVVDAHLA